MEGKVTGAPPVAPAPAPPVGLSPPSGRASVGGELPEDVVARLSAELWDDGSPVPRAPWRHPAIGAVLGGAVVLALLFVTMTVAGALI